MNRHHAMNAFTLIELLVGIIISAILIIPVWRIFSTGTQTAMKGILSIETTLEARRIIRLLHGELKNACCELKDDENNLTFNRLYETGGTPLSPVFSFLSFPLHGAIDGDLIAVTSPHSRAFRRLSRIRYDLEGARTGSRPFASLRRNERFHPDTVLGKKHPEGLTTILSDRVNYFEIKPVRCNWQGADAFYFWIHIRLVDVVKPRAHGSENLEWGKQLERSNNVVMADFYDVVSPDFFMRLWNHPGIRRNWYNTLVGPKGP